MKTTIHIPGALFDAARKIAQEDDTTLKALLEEGLRKVVSERRPHRGQPFRLRKATFKGRGLQPHLAGVTWDQILEIGYKGRAGF